ncbi:LLM class flavin-dependent oxidoreductase [Glycomyces harbinensis]|uniref:Luciferase family oxidoreductase, group 1 n=1 Tax=Glycomyces harbinensis TaxID=58114 RepID=A0A1G6WTR5_9ACTN|nr:LLM class flavin-dependent oxidoreductase [Glycomyces harbinensis]SDD69033.1 luciferase family oxidoreductase, group 1 [Glycomyces harbinensis]
MTAPYGDAPVPLSVLDLATIGPGGAVEALRTTAELAVEAERWGYRRFWVGEHHGIPTLASSAPTVLIAHLAARTASIRIGAGGVMLPNRTPLIVAEEFGTLEALHPGRIDLGVGRAPGGEPATAAALRRNPTDFEHQLSELIGFLDDAFSSDHPYATIRAIPGRVHPDREAAPGLDSRPPIWILGTGEGGAGLAARLGLPFAFAHHLAPRRGAAALTAYRERFEPSPALDRPYALVSVATAAAETHREGLALAKASGLEPPEVVCGDPDEVRGGLETLVGDLGADELMLLSHLPGPARLRSHRLVAGAFGLVAPTAAAAEAAVTPT